jgi:hypothetical protein
MAQIMSKQNFQPNPSTCSPLRKAAFTMGLLRTDPREDSKILGRGIPCENPEYGERLVSLGPSFLKKLALAIRESRGGFSLRAKDGYCYLYNTASIGHNLIVKVNDERQVRACFVFHLRNGGTAVQEKELEKTGAGQKSARVGLVEFGKGQKPLSEIRCLEVYVSNSR